MDIFRSFVSFVALTSGAAVFANTAQQALEGASQYTVQIFRFSKIGLNADDGASSKATGFLIDKKRGWILTNAHVASRSPAKLQIEFKEGGTLDAERVYVDHYLDIAVLAVDPAELPRTASSARLDCSGLPKVGTPVAIFGNPSNFRFVASRGIISGAPWLSHREHVQSDAAINSGNSGGPLIDLETGKVVGVAAESYKDNDDNATVVALSVPMPAVCTVLGLLKSGNDANFRTLPAAIATRPRDERPIVALTDDPNSKLQPGDLILSVDGSSELRNPADLYDRLRGKSGPVQLIVERSGSAIAIESSVRPMEPLLRANSLEISGLVISAPWRLDERFSADRGYLVIDFIIAGTPAENIDVLPGSVVTSIDGRVFSDLQNLHSHLSKKEKGSEVELVIKAQSDDIRFHSSFKVVRLSTDAFRWITPTDNFENGPG